MSIINTLHRALGQEGSLPAKLLMMMFYYDDTIIYAIIWIWFDISA
jgi:hypothetical protein